MKVFVCTADMLRNKKSSFKATMQCDDAFTERGFDILKKALEKFCTHDASTCHIEARMVWSSVNGPTIMQQISNEADKILADRRYC